MKLHRHLVWLGCVSALATLGACAAHGSASNHSTQRTPTPASDADDMCLVQHFGQDFAAAKTSCTSACDAGAKDSCELLARMYAGGEGVEKDGARAQTLYTKACKLGNSRACEASGADAASVVHAKESECNASSESVVRDACKVAGEAYLDGLGVSIDRARAEPLLLKACKLGQVSACDDFKWSPKK